MTPETAHDDQHLISPCSNLEHGLTTSLRICGWAKISTVQPTTLGPVVGVADMSLVPCRDDGDSVPHELERFPFGDGVSNSKSLSQEHGFQNA